MLRQILTLLLLTAAALAQDGSLRFQCAVTTSNVPLISPNGGPPQVDSFSVYGGFWTETGKPVNCGADSLRYVTGSRTDSGAQGDFTQGATWGPGGEFWFKSTQKQYGSCETVTCRFHGTWLYASLVRVQDTPSTWHYAMSGRLTGKYHDATHKNETVAVNFIQPTVESKYLLLPINDGNHPQTVGMGSLEIVGTSQ